MKRLVIISHTEHYIDQNGVVYGLGSTVAEINHLLDIFDEIQHVAMLHNTERPPNTIPYVSDRIKFIPIPALGGKGLTNKLSILWNAPKVLRIIQTALNKSDYFQFRAPTGIGVFVIPYLMWFAKKKGWFKYAGNWVQENPPMSYRIQRFLLKRQKRIVTINGSWNDQKVHCLTFENPCLTQSELSEGKQLVDLKTKPDKGVELCFVGRLEDEKGVKVLLESLIELEDQYSSKLGTIHIVGKGKEEINYSNPTSNEDH